MCTRRTGLLIRTTDFYVIRACVHCITGLLIRTTDCYVIGACVHCITGLLIRTTDFYVIRSMCTLYNRAIDKND